VIHNNSECVDYYIISSSLGKERAVMSRAPIHICFYSNRCDWSKAFITELSQTPYRGEFRFICADPSPTRPQLPSWLKKVPTLVISGEPEPRVDADVFNWLKERQLRDGGGRSSGGGAGAGGAGSGPSEPEPLVSEMGSAFGDSYSMIDTDTSAQGNGGASGVGNFYGFSFLQGNTSVGTKEGSTFQMTDSSGKRSKKEELLDKQMEAYMSQRDSGIPKRIARQ
jgi:hypothetical protein